MTEIAFASIALFFGLFLIVLFYACERLLRLLDRYRLKYGFDREIEKKEMRNPTEDKLNNREKYFKRRTLKD